VGTEAEGSIFFKNAGNHLPNYTVL
jgi:hypothetical protein